MIQPQLTQARLSASALHTVSDGTPKPNTYDKEWQRVAFELTDLVGEMGYLHNLTADTAARCDLIPEKWNGKRWMVTDDEKVVRVLKAFVGPRGGQTELKRRAALHLAIAGESYLIGTRARTKTGAPLGIVWEFVSTEEFVIQQDGQSYRRRDGSGREDLDQDAYVARMWKSHPRWSDQADASTRRILPIAKEIVVLTQLVDAVAKSRLNAGILFVPDDMSFSPQDYEDTDADTGDDGDQEGIDELSDEIMKHMKAPVEDRTSAAALVPLLMRGPGVIGEHATKDLMGLVDLVRDLDTWAQELRREALHRLASGLDAPPETLEGKGALNHWSAYNIDQEFISKHVAPKGDLIADFLSEAYLRPMLEEFESMTPDQAGEYRLAFDTSAVRTVTDEAANGRIVYDRGEASGASLRRTHGLTEADAPSDEERQSRDAKDLLGKIPTLAPTLLPLIDGFEDVAIVAPPVVPGIGNMPGPNPAQGGTPIVQGTPGTPQTQRLPAGRKEATGPAPSNGTEPTANSGSDVPVPRGPGLSAIVRDLVVAADAALDRAFERAGTRLASSVVNKKDDPLCDRVRGVDRVMVMSLASPADLSRIDLSPTKLLDGAWDRISATARKLIREYLEAEGENPLLADDKSALAASNLCQELDTYARFMLHRSLPTHTNGMRVPDDLVIRALSAALPVAVVV